MPTGSHRTQVPIDWQQRQAGWRPNLEGQMEDTQHSVIASQGSTTHETFSGNFFACQLWASEHLKNHYSLGGPSKHLPLLPRQPGALWGQGFCLCCNWCIPRPTTIPGIYFIVYKYLLHKWNWNIVYKYLRVIFHIISQSLPGICFSSCLPGLTQLHKT